MAFVQENLSNPGSGTTGTCVQGSNVTSGNLVIVCTIAGPIGVAGPSSVADTVGTSYSNIVNTSLYETPAGTAIFAGTAAASGANTITVTATATASFFNIWVLEFSGTTATLDGTSVNKAPETAVTSGSIVTTNANDLLIGYLVPDDGITAGEAGWTVFLDNANSGTCAEYKIVSATGTYAATGTASPTTGNCFALIAAFQLSSTTNVNGTFSGTGKASGTFKAFILKDAVLSI